MDIQKVKVTLLSREGDDPNAVPFPQSIIITDIAGNTISPHWPIDIHIDPQGSFVTLRMPAEIEVEGQLAIADDDSPHAWHVGI